MNYNIRKAVTGTLTATLFYLLLMSILFSYAGRSYAQESTQKKILILTEGNTDLKSFAFADGRQLAVLLGHFNTKTTLIGVNQYSKNELNNFDFIFYIGYRLKNKVPDVFLNDVLIDRKRMKSQHTT